MGDGSCCCYSLYCLAMSYLSSTWLSFFFRLFKPRNQGVLLQASMTSLAAVVHFVLQRWRCKWLSRRCASIASLIHMERAGNQADLTLSSYFAPFLCAEGVIDLPVHCYCTHSSIGGAEHRLQAVTHQQAPETTSFPALPGVAQHWLMSWGKRVEIR